MRVGVDYRILADGPALMGRGIGRFTQQQLREVLRLDSECEYVLLCPPGTDLSPVLPCIREAPNVEIGVVDVPGFAHPSSDEPSGSVRLTESFGAWLRNSRIDLYHVTSPFVLDQPDFPGLGGFPVVATVYDLIPYVFADEYLSEQTLRRAYMSAVDFVVDATRILAISEATRDHVVNLWGYSEERVDVCSPFAERCFQPLEAGELAKSRASLRERVALPSRYALTVTALHHAKNAPVLFEAFGLLPASVRLRMPLVVCCHLGAREVRVMRRLADEHGIGDDVVITGFVPDAELAALYNGATLVAHPSLYEGFGLPVLEAMQSGAPVITSTSSSLPEVAGAAAVLVDPFDVKALARAMIEVEAHGLARQAMGRAGIERSRSFGPRALGKATLDAYRRALADPSRPPKIVVAPPRSGSDRPYTERLLVAEARPEDGFQLEGVDVARAGDVGDESQDPAEDVWLHLERLGRVVARALDRQSALLIELEECQAAQADLRSELLAVSQSVDRRGGLTGDGDLGAPGIAVVVRRCLARRWPRASSWWVGAMRWAKGRARRVFSG